MKCEAGYLVRLAAEQHGDRIALTYRGTNYSFAEVNRRANLVGSALRGLGLEIGDRVGVLAYNCPEVLDSWFGCEKSGLVRVVLHSHFDITTHARSLNDVQARVLIFDSRLVDKIETHRKHMKTVRHFIAIGDECPAWAIRFEELVRSGAAAEFFLDVDEDNPCFLQLTSGTTGPPKAWTKTYRSWLAVITQNIIHFDTLGCAPPISTNDVNLHFQPIQSSSGFKTLYPYFVRGARSVLTDDETFDPELLVDTLVREGVTGTLIHGRLLALLLDVAEAKGEVEHQLQRVVVSFATPELLSRFTKVFGSVWCHTYGSTEQGSAITRLLPRDLVESPDRLSSVGKVAAPLVEIAIMDEFGNRVPSKSVGEIVVRGPMSAGWYWGPHDHATSTYLEHDWFRSGDAGYLDDDGYLYYADRIQDLIHLKTGVVYPYTVESALLTHESVANCGVVAVLEGGVHVIVGAIQLKAGYSPGIDLENEILSCAASRLPMQHRPKRLTFLDVLPTVQGGAKVRRSAIRELLKEQS